MRERCLTDEHWGLVKGLLPGKSGDPGCHGRDNRLFLEAVLWMARNRAPWRDLPAEFGKWYTTYTRFRRWRRKGVWPKVLEALSWSGEAEYFWRGDEIVYAARGEPAQNKAA